MPDKKTPPPLPPDALSRPTASQRPSAPPPSPEHAMPSPWDEEVLSSAPKPVTKSPFGGATWMNNAGYPLVKPEHAEELEQNAAVNEFGLKQPRAAAEAGAYDSYKKRQHTEAAAHHLAGMKAAHGAGDMEAARKHSLMYGLHSKALGHEPVGPAHPDVVAHLSGSPAKVYKFKPHHGDQLALSPPAEAPKAPGVVSSAPAPELGKNEREALYTIYVASQALLKGEYTKFPEKTCPSCGTKHTPKVNQRSAGPEQHCPGCAHKYDRELESEARAVIDKETKKAEGGVQTAKLTVTDKFHGAGKQLGPTVQVDKGPHTRRPSPPRTEAAYRKDEADPKPKAADRGAKASNTTCKCGNYKPYYADTCSECNKKTFAMGKAETEATKRKGVKPCICPAYGHPHRFGGGKCGKGK